MVIVARQVDQPVTICLLGAFRVLKRGQSVSLKPGGKAQSLLANLAFQTPVSLARDELLALLWPDSDHALASQSLNTLTYTLHRTLGDALAGRPPVLQHDGHYSLNEADGVAVDIAAFDAAADDGDRATRAGDTTRAAASYRGAAHIYQGDLVLGSEVRHVVERERLRARYLAVRSRLVDLRFVERDYQEALVGALDILGIDPCREDAHRLVMRCYNRLGERAQALRQYRICREVLAKEFDAIPEPATDDLYRMLRVDPTRV